MRSPPTPNPSLFSALGICPDLELLVSSSADLWRWHMSCVGEDWGGSGGDKGAWSWSVAQSKSESAFVSKDGHVWPKTQTAPHPLISARKHLLGCWRVGEGWRWALAHVATLKNSAMGSKPPLNSWAAGRDVYMGEEQENEWSGICLQIPLL